jgi:hypothetical protein
VDHSHIVEIDHEAQLVFYLKQILTNTMVFMIHCYIQHVLYIEFFIFPTSGDIKSISNNSLKTHFQ